MGVQVDQAGCHVPIVDACDATGIRLRYIALDGAYAASGDAHVPRPVDIVRGVDYMAALQQQVIFGQGLFPPAGELPPV